MLNESFPPARRIQTNALYLFGGDIPNTGLGAAREFIIPSEVNEDRNVEEEGREATGEDQRPQGEERR